MRPFLCCLILLSGCKPAVYFVSPNDLHNEKAQLYLIDHSKVTGEINISLESYSSLQMENKPFIGFIPEGEKIEKHIRLNDIIGYSIGSDYFALKKLDLYLNNTYYLLFVKRLTSENSKIQLYELFESGRGNATGEMKYSYYLSLPSFGQQQTMNTRSISLLPMFDQRMSQIVADCPALAAKIKSKENGYFIPMGSFKTNKHHVVLLKIINEYNNCN